MWNRWARYNFRA